MHQFTEEDKRIVRGILEEHGEAVSRKSLGKIMTLLLPEQKKLSFPIGHNSVKALLQELGCTI